MADIFQPTDKLKSLYQGLSQNDGLKTPYEQFEKDMMDTAKLRQIHTFLSNKPGFEVPWDDFQSQLFSQNGKEDKEEVKIPQERFQQPPQMPQDTFSPTIPEPEMGDLKPISNVPLPEDLDTSKIPVVKDNLRTEYRTPNPLRDAVDYMETQRKDFVGSLYNGLRELGANIAVGGIELPELMGSLTGANLLKSGIGKVIPAYGRFTEREKEQKEKIKSDIYEWGQANHIEVGESMGSFVGGMLPFIGMVVASTYMPALAPYTTGAFAAMGAGEGYGAIKRTEENRLNEAINAVVAQEGGITKERIAELQQEVGLNGLAKAAAPIGYSLVYSIPMTKYMSKMINPALYRKAARQLFKIPEVNNAAMKTGIEILEKWAQKDKAAAMNYIKQMARGSAHSIATMESIHLGKTAVDKAILGENPEDFWNQVGHSALSGLFFGMVTTPFGIATQNRANQRRREAQGVVKLTLDAKNRPVEILPGEVEGKRKGVTPDGRIVDVTKEMNNRGVEISTKIFNEQVNQFKQTGEFSPYIVPKEAVSRYEMFINRFSKDGKVKYNTTEHGHRIVILEETTPEGAREKHFDVINIDNGRIVNVPESSIKQGGEINTSELINNFSKNVHELYNREQERQGKIGTESAPESPQPPRQPIPRQPSPREQYETQVRNETAPFVNENGNIVVYKDAITESGEPVFLIKGDPESGEGFFIRTASGEEQFITDKSRLTGERTELTVDQFIQDKLTEWDEAQQARQTVEDNTVDIDGQKFVVIGEQDNEMILQPIDEQQNPIGDVKFVSKEQLAQEAGEEAARQEIAATEQAKEQGRLITINETDYPVETQEDGSFIVSLPENGDPAVFESDIRSTLPGEQQNRIELLTEDVIVPPAVPWGQGTTQKVTVGIRILPEGQKTVPQEAISPAGETATPKVEATLPGEVISPELPLNQPTYTQNKKETTRENILSLVDESINELDASKLDGIRVDNDPELSKALTEAVNSINETNETAQNLLNSFDKAKTSNEYTKLADQFRALPDNVQAKFNKEFKSKDAVLKKLVKKEGEREWIRQQEEREYVPFEESGDSFNQWASLHATNPHDIHEAYQNELANAPYNLLQGWQLDLLGEKFTSKSFKRYADPNWLSQGLARAWLGGEKRRTIDQFTAAWEMESGEVIDPQQVVDFMMQYPTKNVRKTTDLSQELARRYRYITGESIKNYSSARKLPPAEKLFDKFITDNKLENDYFTSEDALKLLETHRDKLSTEEYETIKKHLENEITESEQAASFWGEEEPVSPLGETTERERHGVQDEAEAEERLLQSPGLDRGTETREQSLTDVFGQAETQEEIRVRKLNEKLKGLTEAQKQLAKIEIDKAKKTAKAQGDLFSGEQETSYLKRAIGENANLKRKVKRNLERAKRMHNQGFDPLIIKYETGWEQGVDKMWRYEVADDYERFDEAFKKIDNRGIFADTNMTFYELIGDDPLFDDYPRLKDMKFTKLSPFLDVFGSIQGWYNEETNTLNITPYVQDKRATLIHEVQHAIQAIENWARGGNEQVAALSLPVEKIKEIAEKVKEKLRENIIKMDAEIKEARNLIKYFKENPEKKDLLQKYSIEYEELFEIQMKRYNELKQKDENINPFIEDDIVKEISNQKLKAFKNITNIIKDATGNKPTNYKLIFKIKEKKTFEAGFSSIIAENIKKKSEINDKIRAIDQAKTKQEIFESVKDNAGSAFYNAYRAIAGEEEARAMSKRDNLTPRERKESLISSSFDVAPEEQIVIFGKQGESKSALPTETITLTNGIKLTPDTYRDNPIVRIDNIGDNLTKLVRAGAVQSPEGTLFIPAGKFNESLRKMQELMNVSIQETPTESKTGIIGKAFQQAVRDITGERNVRIGETEIDTGDGETVIQHSIEITPEIIANTQQGMPLFKNSFSGIEKGTVSDKVISNEIKSVFDILNANAVNAGAIHVVQTPEQLPPKFAKDAVRLKNTQGFYLPTTGETYFITDNISSPKEALKTWVHEVTGHKGLRNLIPEHLLTPLLEKFYDDLGGAEVIDSSLPSSYRNASKAEKMEEYITFLAEDIINERDLTPQKKSFWKKILDGIMNLLNKLFDKKVKFTHADVEELIRASVQSVYQKEKESERFKDRATQETMPKYFDEVLASIKRGELRERKSGDMLKSEKNAQKYFEVNPDRLRHTLSVFNRPEFRAYRDKNIRPNELQGLLNLSGVKAIEKELIRDVVRSNYPKTKLIPYNELEAVVRANIIPLERIESTSYADYGADAIQGDFDNAYTLIFNFPEVEHGKEGHFSYQFTPDKTRKIDYVPKQLDENTWVAVEDGYMEQGADESNIMRFVGTAANSREKVEKWINDYEERFAEGIKDVNRGMYGHIRIWERGNDVIMAEVQSDFFQKFGARTLFIENEIKNNPELQKEQDKINDSFKEKIIDFLKNSKDYEIDNASVNFKGKELFGLIEIKDLITNYGLIPNRAKEEHAELLKQIEKAKKELQKELARFENKVYSMLSPAEKQFIASAKVWEKRLLHEAIAEAMDKGADRFLIPTPHTLATIEGYIGGAAPPYEVISDRNAYSNGNLGDGDIIEMGGEEYVVIESDPYNEYMRIAPAKDMDRWKIREALQDDVDFKYDELAYEYSGKLSIDDINEIGDTFYVSEVKEILLEGLNSKAEEKGESIEDVFIELDDFQEEIEEAIRSEESEKYRFDENVKEYFEDELGYSKAIKVGDEIFIWKSEPHYEIISQPGQNRVNIDDFNIEDLAESEQRVLKKYEEYGEQLKEEFGDNVSNEVDENGYGWVAVDLSGVETGRPVVAYRTKHENPHLWKNWTREGEKYVSAQGKEWNVPDTGTLKHEVYQKLMENIDNHRTKAFEPEIFDYWFNKHRKNLKGNLGAVGNTTTVAAQMYDMMPQRYSYKPEPNLKTRLSFPENGWLEVDRDVFMHRDGQVWEAPVEGTIANDIYKQVIDNITKSERNFDPAIFNVLMNAFENSISQYELFRGRSIYYSLAKKIADTISDAMPKDETIRYRTKGNSAKNVAQEATKPEKPMFLDQMAQAEHDAKVAEEMYTKAKREKPNWHEEQRRMREFWIDQNLPIEGWEADILNNGGKMNEYSKPYRDMRNSFGRIEYLYNKFQKEFMLPFPKILADVVKQGISQELAVSYMIARSGLKRNEVMRSEELESWADKRLELLKKKHPDKKITLENVKNSKEYKAKHKELSNTDFASLTGFREEGDPRHPDEVARSIVFWVESKLTPETTERIWEHWNKTAQGIRDIWLEGGEITKEQYNFLNKRMPDYVPMRGWRHGKSEEIIYHKEGGKGKSYMKAKGRVSLPDNPIAVIQTMGFKAISEQVSNEVNTAALNLMVNNYGEKFKDMHRFKKAYFVQEIIRDADGNPEKVWTLYREPVTRPDGSTDYEIATPPESMFDSGEARQFISREHEQLRTVYNAKEHEVIVKKAGVPYVMIFDEKYTTVAQALNHNNTMFRFLGREWDARKIGDNPIIDGMATVTNFMKGMMTTHSPVFPITNAPRDQQNVAITQYIKNNSRIGKANKYTTPEGASSIWRFLDEGKEFVPRNETDRLLIAFYENGGAVGFTRDKSVKQIEKELKRQLKYAFRKGTIKQSTIDAARFLFDRIARYNTVIEDLTRFSVFQYGVKDLGLSYKDAAFESRTSSDDFNMRGKGTKIFETWWAFFKASINELDKDVRLAKYNPGRAFTSAAMMVLWGYIEALFNDTADGDKDDYFSINPYVRQNYMVIKTGKKYFRMPISQFWRGFHAMGVNIYDAAWGHITPGQAAGRTIASLIGGMSPVDLTELFSDGKLTLGALVPTSIKPIYEVKVNRDFMDNTIYHEKFTLKMQEEARNSNLHKKNVNVAAKFMTDMLWKLGGGDDGDNRIIVDKDGELKYVPRVFDVNPAWIEHLFRGYTGGVGRFLTDLTKFVYELVAPNEAISINNTPFLNSFLRNTPDDKWKYIREWQNVMKYAQMWKAEDTEAYRGAKSEDSTGEDFDYAYSLKNMKNNEIYQTFMAYNRNIERIVKAKGLQDEDAAHEITDLMKEGIERINEIKKQHKK